MMFQNITLIIILVVTVAMFLLQSYQQKKNREYANDERWQAIQIEVKKVVNNYFEWLIIPIVIVKIVTSIFIETTIYVDLYRVLLVAFLVHSARSVVGLLAFKYYDKRM